MTEGAPGKGPEHGQMQPSWVKSLGVSFGEIDSLVEREGDALVVRSQSAFHRTMIDKFGTASRALRSDPRFSEIQEDGFSVHATPKEPVGDIQKLVLHFTKES